MSLGTLFLVSESHHCFGYTRQAWKPFQNRMLDPALEGIHSIPSRNGIPVDGRIDYDVLGDVYKYVFGKRFDLAFWARGTPFI